MHTEANNVLAAPRPHNMLHREATARSAPGTCAPVCAMIEAEVRPTRGAAPVDEHVTVVVPTKDRPETLARTIASIRWQRHVSMKWIAVDDGSSPENARRIAAQRGEDGDVVRHDASRGVSAARNTGLAAVRTPWVAFLDDDDLWGPDKTARQIAAAARTGAGWVCSSSVHFSDAGGVLGAQAAPAGGDVLAPMLRRNVVPGGGSGVLARTEVVRRVGGFDTAFSTLADRECWLRLAEVSPLATVPAADVGYRVHPSSMAHDIPLAGRELGQLRTKHDGLYRRLGVEIDPVPWLDYLRAQARRTKDRRAEARLTLQLVLRHGRPAALAHPLFALLPGPVQESVRRSRRRKQLDPALLEEAREWLGALRAVELASHPGF